MGRRGPPPKPTALKKLQGTFRADRAARNEPTPPRGRPTCPKHLGPIARAFWKRIEPVLLDMGVLTVADRTVLELTCMAYAEYRQAAEAVTRDGPVTGGKGKARARREVKTHPAVTVREGAWRRTLVGLRELGLTPAARTRIEGQSAGPLPAPVAGDGEGPGPKNRIPGDPNDPLAEFLN